MIDGRTKAARYRAMLRDQMSYLHDPKVYAAKARKLGLMKKMVNGVPLPMFECQGEQYSRKDFARHMEIANKLHLMDLAREAHKGLKR